MLYLRYKSSITCLLSCSVCAFTPTTFTAYEHKSHEAISLCASIAGLLLHNGRGPLGWVLQQDIYLVSYVDLGEAQSLQVNAGGPDGRSDGFH